MIKLLIGGSPCTHWSIAQKNGREVEPEGIGWELFKNYLIAKEKFNPDLFLYENNKSAAKAIKEQISRELGVDLMYINSALVSAQNRQRFYAFNWIVEQPEDRGIYLQDILEPSTLYAKKSHILPEPVPVNTTDDGKSQTIKAQYAKNSAANFFGYTSTYGATGVAEPIVINVRMDGKARTVDAHMAKLENNLIPRINNPNPAKQQHDCIFEPVKNPNTCATDPITAPFNPIKDWKSHTITASYGKISERPTFRYKTERDRQRVIETWTGEERPVYEVKNGWVEIPKKYPVKLPDGLYIIRKLTPIECERLQTLPDNYTAAVSNTQRYKGIGNGWTAEVIIHVLNGAFKDVPRDEEIVVLSMYDGIGTGRYCLEKMGFTNIKYYAYEIDEPAMKVALSNFPDIIQSGDAFDLRRDDWELGKIFKKVPTNNTKGAKI